MFRNRTEAGRHLAERLRARAWNDPVVLGIPRGGVIVGRMVAQLLPGEFDVLLVRKLRAPNQRELAIGGVAEDGTMFLDEQVIAAAEVTPDYIEEERARQIERLNAIGKRFRAVRPAVSVEGRAVILVDDGMATGSTVIAGVRCARAKGAREVVVAVPVAAEMAVRAAEVVADEVICVTVPDKFYAVGQFYEQFDEVSDEQAVEALATVRDASMG